MKREHDAEIQENNISFAAIIEPLLTVLLDRPIRLLWLMQTSKELREYLTKDSFVCEWRRMTTRLIKRELGTYMSEVYPFFVTENKRFKQSDYPNQSISFDGRDRRTISSRGNLMVMPRLGVYNSGHSYEVVEGVVTSEFYYYVKYDEYTRHFVDLLHHVVECDNEWAESLLRRYLGGNDVKYDFVACYLDGFLVQHNTTPVFQYPHNMTKILKSIQENDVCLSPTVMEENLSALSSKKALKARSLLSPVVIRLDESTIEPWKKNFHAMYGTATKMMRLFVGFLHSFMSDHPNRIENLNDYDKEQMVRYGTLFHCVFCHTATRKVDPHLELAFCRLSCRNAFLS